MDKRNLELLTDFYEFTMANGYFMKNMNNIAYFDIFFRKNPDDGGYSIFAGLEQIIDFVTVSMSKALSELSDIRAVLYGDSTIKSNE